MSGVKIVNETEDVSARHRAIAREMLEPIVNPELLLAIIAQAEKQLGPLSERDQILAIFRAPDSTNDGGPADVVEEVRTAIQNLNTVINDLMEAQ